MASNDRLKKKRVLQMKRSLQKEELEHKLDDFSGSDNEDIDFSKEIRPIGYYINDREKMIEEMFSVIKNEKLKKMLPPVLKKCSLEEVKADCLVHLLGMSKKRIYATLQGRDLNSSSDSETDSSNSVLGSDSSEEPQITSSTHIKSDVEEIDDTLDISVSKNDLDSLIHDKRALPTTSRKRGDKSKLPEKPTKKIKTETSPNLIEISDDELVVHKKKKKDEKRSKKKPDKKPKPKHKHSKDKSKKNKSESSGESSDKEDSAENGSVLVDSKKGKSLLEILELEMRARAIRALLESNTAVVESASKIKQDPEAKLNNSIDTVSTSADDQTAENIDESDSFDVEVINDNEDAIIILDDIDDQIVLEPDDIPEPAVEKPSKNDTSDKEPSKSVPSNKESSKNSPLGKEPSKSSSSKESSENSSSSKEPTKAVSSKKVSDSKEPSKNIPPSKKPSKSVPTNKESSKSVPANEEPAKSVPSNKQPPRSSPTKKDSSKTLPSNKELSKSTPSTKETPTNNPPDKEPSKSDPPENEIPQIDLTSTPDNFSDTDLTWPERWAESKGVKEIMQNSKLCANIRKRMRFARMLKQKQQEELQQPPPPAIPSEDVLISELRRVEEGSVDQLQLLKLLDETKQKSDELIKKISESEQETAIIPIPKQISVSEPKTATIPIRKKISVSEQETATIPIPKNISISEELTADIPLPKNTETSPSSDKEEGEIDDDEQVAESNQNNVVVEKNISCHIDLTDG